VTDMETIKVSATNFTAFINPPVSKWKCEMFGSNNFIWRPLEGQEPNWFWRWMQYLAFGNRWSKDEWDKEEQA
jgi:hypothetical protein